MILSSCINEDIADCVQPQSGVNLQYDYLLNMNYTNLFENEIGNLKAFIFDENGILCDTLLPPTSKGELTNEWNRQVNLSPGTYSILTWAGDKSLDETYQITHENNPIELSAKGVVIGQTKLTDIRTFLCCANIPGKDNEAVPQMNRFNDLYYGFQENITVKPEIFTIVHTSLIKDSKTIRVKIGKLSTLHNPALSESDFDILLTGHNGHYKFDNTTNETSRLIRYIPYLMEEKEDTLYTNIKTLRLRKHKLDDQYSSQILLNVLYKPTNTVICQDLDLVDLILDSKIPARNEKGEIQKDSENKTIFIYPSLEYLDRQDIFDITFGIENIGGHLDFTIFVNGWQIINITPDA